MYTHNKQIYLKVIQRQTIIEFQLSFIVLFISLWLFDKKFSYFKRFTDKIA